MAGPQKKRAVQQKSESDNDMESDSEYTGQEEILADFEGRNPEGQDFHGIKQLLNQLFLKAHIDLSQMSDMLISQVGLGSVLKQSSGDDIDDDDDEEMSDPGDVFGITSVINLTQNRETPCVQQFFALLKELSQSHADKSTNEEILKILGANKKLGLIINERFVNIPPRIADPMLTSLENELDRMKKKNNNYNFDYYIMICKTYKSKPHKNKESELVFSNAEEELFAKNSKFSFDFDVLSESDTGLCGKWTEGDVEMIPFRKVLLFEASQFSNIIQQVKVFVA